MKFTLAVAVTLSLALSCSYGQSVDECLQKDSISCLQRSLFKKVKEFFDKESFELVKGVSLVKSDDASAAAAAAGSSRSAKELIYQQEIDAAKNVAERQSALEKFVGEQVGQFLMGRSLKINFKSAFAKIGDSTRAFTDSVPSELKQAADEIVEGRGRKKFLRSVLPLLLAAKVKIGLLATLGYFSIALLAKKAILASAISIAISTFLGFKSLWASKHGGYDSTGYNSGYNSVGGSIGSSWSAPAGSSGWNSGPSGWDDTYGSSQAYSAYH